MYIVISYSSIYSEAALREIYTDLRKTLGFKVCMHLEYTGMMA